MPILSLPLRDARAESTALRKSLKKARSRCARGRLRQTQCGLDTRRSVRRGCDSGCGHVRFSQPACRIRKRACKAGETIVQARYDVLNTDDSWRTRLMSCALALAHVVKPLGRERLRLVGRLEGQWHVFCPRGGCERSLVGRVRSRKTSSTRCAYARRVIAWHLYPKPACGRKCPQRARRPPVSGSGGRAGGIACCFKWRRACCRESIRTRNRLLRDRAIELIVPPFAEMFAFPALCGGLCVLLAWLCGWHTARLLAEAWALILVLQAVYLFGGMWVARMPARVVFPCCSPHCTSSGN